VQTVLGAGGGNQPQGLITKSQARHRVKYLSEAIWDAGACCSCLQASLVLCTTARICPLALYRVILQFTPTLGELSALAAQNLLPAEWGFPALQPRRRPIYDPAE
jgi:hypothetical protein